MLSKLTDRLILAPSRDHLDSEDKRRRELPLREGVSLEMYCERTGDERPNLIVVKFPGAGGRAERSTAHPADQWPHASDVWTVNPPGYGRAQGAPSLRWLPSVAETATAQALREAAGRPVILVGNSLGCVAALYAGARLPVAGLLLRNPPPLRQVIRRRFGLATLGMAELVASRIPAALCSLENAARCTAPALFISSQRDRVVPTRLQRRIVAEYQGPRKVLALPSAGHATPISDEEAEPYRRRLTWLLDHSFRQASSQAPCARQEPDQHVG